MDESFAAGDLVAGGRLKALCARSNAHGLRQLGLHLLAIAGTGLALAGSMGTAWVVPAILLYGIVLVFLFAALHESIHRTAFASRRLNDGVAWLCGLVVVLPPSYFRHYHVAHHRHTQDPARDPELQAPAPVSAGAYLWWISGMPYWLDRVRTVVRHAGGRIEEPFVPAGAKRRVVDEARLFVLCYGTVAAAALAARSWAPLLYWLLPVLAGQPALRLFLLAEHTGRPMVPDMMVNTRTTRANGLVRRLAWNMPYHVEHHLFPGVPFHALPALHRELGERVEAETSGYSGFHRQLLRDLRRYRGAAAGSSDEYG